MKTDELVLLLRAQEGPTLEFKSSWYAIDSDNQAAKSCQRDELIKDVLALANGSTSTAGETAHLIIGAHDQLDDDGSRQLTDAVGFPVKDAGERLMQIVSAACNPALGNITAELVPVDDRHLGVITIQPSPHLHETTRDLRTSARAYSERVVFIRSGATVRIASAEEREAIRRVKVRRFREYRNAPPVAFGSVVGATIGTMAGITAVSQHGAGWIGRLAGLILGGVLFGGLGAGIGFAYRQVIDVWRVWARIPSLARLLIASVWVIALLLFVFALFKQVVG